MASSFGGINTALTSLYAQRQAIDVTGQNIANANTEGYTRQRVNMQSQVGAISPAMYARIDGVGTGVSVSDVQRLRDEYLENRGRTEHANSAYLTSQTAAYTEIETMFAEPSSTALQAQLHDMWDAWGDVANNPQLPAARSALIQQSRTVADGLNNAHAGLANQWGQNRAQLGAYVDEVNTAARTVAQLNASIVHAKASGVTVNELEDQRDQQVMRLSTLTGAVAAPRPNGAMDVFIGSSTLVSEFTVSDLEAVGADAFDNRMQDPVLLRWAGTENQVSVGGTVGAVCDNITKIIPDISKALDEVAQRLADIVNTAHISAHSADGNTGQPFFSGTTAKDIRVVVTEPDQVATSGSAGVVDGSVASRLAESSSKADGPDLRYQAMIGKLGVDAQGASRRADIQAAVTQQVDAAREAQSGVNLDEEMTNLLTYQRGYEAASRVLTTIDSMLDQLINRTGLVGR